MTTLPVLPKVKARDHEHPERQQVWFAADRFVQSADLNDTQLIARGRHDRLGRLIAKEGDRVEGCEVVVNRDAGTIMLGGGRVYVAGDTFPVAERRIEGAPLEGRVQIGVVVDRTLIDHEDDPSLLGQEPGTEAEGEDGHFREVITLAWALETEISAGDEFVSVYEMIDGTVINQAPPPALTGVIQQIARYDWDAHGHYIVDGCEVRALGKQGGDWVFSIGAGTANIQGFKRIREAAIRHLEPEHADLEDVVAEVHTFSGPTGGSTEIAVQRPPIASLTSAIVVKRMTETIVRGAVPGTADALQYASVTVIESVTQGGTTFDPSAYLLANGEISWSPSGAEPTGGSTYQVTYLYQDAVTPDEVTPRTVSVSGGVQGTQVTLRYMSKIPRIDLMCLDLTGASVYVKGISSRRGALAPLAPTALLKLAEIRNDWLDLPRVVNNGTRNYTYDKMRRLFARLIDVLDQFDRQAAQQAILEATPVAKKGIFTDTFVDDFFRDQGLPQTAAINQGVLQLAIDPVMLQLADGSAVTLPYDEFVIVSQTARTSSMKINPYDNFTAMPAGLKLEPASDFWTELQTEWTSPITREFTAAPDQPPGQTVINEVTEIRREAAATLRQITVQATIEGFGVGEILDKLTFGGVDVKPAGEQSADANGIIHLAFQIPSGVPTGRSRVRAEGMAGTFAEAIFVGEGVIDVSTMRRVTLVAREAPVPVVNNITNITQVTNITNNIITQQVVRQPEDRGASNNGPGGVDPLAQTFMVPAPVMITGVNFWFTEIGNRANGVRVQLSTVNNGYPTAEILAEAFINMATVEVGQKVEARFDLPVALVPQREYCFVILTADDTHAVAISRLGDVDLETQKRVAAQPYTVGVLFSSANRLAWTAHQDADMAFEIVAARFTQESRTVTLWQGMLDQISDLLVRSAVEIPSEAAGFRYELVRASGRVTSFAPGQTLEFAEYLSEEVTLRAVLSGTELVSPVLYPGTLIAGGRIRDEGTYATRLFPFGSNVEVSSLFAARLPAGSSVEVQVRGEGGAWQTMTLEETTILGGGWIEPKYRRATVTAAQGQVLVTLHGGPAARPSIARMRAYSI
jgi:hypothetical protein